MEDVWKKFAHEAGKRERERGREIERIDVYEIIE